MNRLVYLYKGTSKIINKKYDKILTLKKGPRKNRYKTNLYQSNIKFYTHLCPFQMITIGSQVTELFNFEYKRVHKIII